LLIRLICAAVASTAIVCRAPLAAQSAAVCNTQECLVFNQIWIPAGQLHELKNQFVAAVRQLVEASSSRYGDEGAAIAAGLRATEQSLARWDDGIRFYEGIMARLDDSAEVHVGLGTVYLDRSRLDDALREFARASRMDPQRSDAHTLSALAYGAAHNREDAARALRASAALDSSNPITRYGLAQELLASGKADDAKDALRAFEAVAQSNLRDSGNAVRTTSPFERVSLLRQGAGVAPIFPLQIYRRGFELLLDGRYGDGIAELTRTSATDPLAAFPAGPPNGVAEAAALLRAGEIEPARQRLTRAVEETPKQALVHRALGIAEWADERFDEAIAELTTAVELEPGDERSRLALADIFADAGRPLEAERTLDDAIRSFPESGQAHYRLGKLYQERSLVHEAIRELEAASLLAPVTGLDNLYETIGALYASEANFDGAVAAYSKRAEVNPNNPDAHRKLGEIYFLQGRDDEALAEFLTTLLLDPANAESRSGAAQVYVRMGKYEEAAESARLALARNAALKEAHYALAMSLVRLGKTEDAKRELDDYQRLQADAMSQNRRLSELKIILLDASQRAAAQDYAGAAARYRDALAIDADSVDVLRDLSLALEKSNRPGEAIPLLEKAVRLADRADVHQLLSNAYKAAGRLDDSQAQAALAAQAVERRKAARLRRAAGAQ
jgi:tetratricopeptide (TPR) repeat protein